MIQNIVDFKQSNFSPNSRYLWIWNPTEIPPHMGISVQNNYFSLKASGTDLGTNLTELIELISRKKMPVLAIELLTDFSLNDCQSIFSRFSTTVPNEITCLHPIKELVAMKTPTKLIELINELEAAQRIGDKISWNISDSHVILSNYSSEDIHAYLLKLANG